jgi:GT2 family glycosyltransferase
VWGASAAAALYRRDMLDRIGLFDEEFESYYEDVDLAWRARRVGWRCRYVPDRCVQHVHSATGGRDPDRKLFLLTRNRWWTIARNYPLSRLWLMWPLLGLADLLSLARGLIRQRNRTPLTARLAALQGLPHVWRTRPTH